MAPVYADHPYALIRDKRPELKEGESYDAFHHVAGEMTCVHNAFIRGINAVYLQAPHVKPADVPAFLNFAQMFYAALHIHHHEEEDSFFPSIQALTGENDIMDGNIEQHRAFHDGLEAYGTYVAACLAGTDKFDGARLIAIIDSFGPAMARHLDDEIDTLLALSRFGLDKLKDYPKMAADNSQKAIASAGLATGIPYVMTCIDRSFEGGRWASFPPAPAILLLAIRYIFHHIHGSWWKFSPCDSAGRLRPLYAVPESE